MLLLDLSETTINNEINNSMKGVRRDALQEYCSYFSHQPLRDYLELEEGNLINEVLTATDNSLINNIEVLVPMMSK